MTGLSAQTVEDSTTPNFRVRILQEWEGDPSQPWVLKLPSKQTTHGLGPGYHALEVLPVSCLEFL